MRGHRWVLTGRCSRRGTGAKIRVRQRGRPLTSMSARPPRPIGAHIGVLPGRGNRRSAGGLKGRSAHEEIVRRLDRTIRATQLARDLLRCQHDLAHGFFNG